MPLEDRLEFIELIGEGGMGKVFKVYDHIYNRVCAFKLSQNPHDSNDIDETIREAALWFEFRNIGQVVEILEIIKLEDHRFGILMEYLPGGNLRKYIDRGISLDDKYLALFDIAAAISNCRTNLPGYCHLDIKPENCLRTELGLIKLTDFGLSCLATDATRPMPNNKGNLDLSLSIPVHTSYGIRCIGTPLYMAPEQIVGTIEDPSKIDMYSFGVMASEILLNKHPLYGSHTLDEVFDAHTKGLKNKITKWPDNIPNELIELILYAISQNPPERPDFTDIIELLRSIYDGPRGFVVTNLEKLSDPYDDGVRKGKSLWAIGQHEAAISVIKSNLEADPFDGDLWYCLSKIEWECWNSQRSNPSDGCNNELINAKDICAHVFRAMILEEKFRDPEHEDSAFFNIIPQVANQKDIASNDMDSFYKWRSNFFNEQSKWIEEQEIGITDGGGPVRCLCVHCGNVKMYILQRCSNCGFLPTIMTDIYHTYLLTIQHVTFPDTGTDAPYWRKMDFLRMAGKNICETLNKFEHNEYYQQNYQEFKQSIGKQLYNMANWDGDVKNYPYLGDMDRDMGMVEKKPKFKDRIKRWFKK